MTNGKVTQKVGYLKMRFLSHRSETDFDLIWKILNQIKTLNLFNFKRCSILVGQNIIGQRC